MPLLLRNLTLPVGIDEETGMVNDGPAGSWTVYGKGVVTVYPADGPRAYRDGERLELPSRSPQRR